MRTSLFKQTIPRDLPRREIKIKPVHFHQSQQERSTETLEDTASKIEQVKQELEMLQEKRRTILAETEAQIQQEKAKWQQEKEKLVQEAKKEGFEAGFLEGEKRSLNQYEAKIAEVNRLVDLVKIDYQKTLERTEDVIIDLAIHTAEKILSQKLSERPDEFIHIVKEALKEINDQSVVSIYLHPSNYEIVLTQKQELKRLIGNDTKLSLYINEELKEGSCIIEHPFGQIDASVDTQLEAIRNALKEFIMEQGK